MLKHLATGGMGSVYLARATGPAGFERHVVIKMLETWREEDEHLEMFLDEARVVGRMHHQHIAPAHELDRDEEGRYFLVMDYIHGQTARTVWSRTGELGVTLPLNFTLTVVIAAAAALHYAHTLRSRDGKPLRIVHRDVSPSNLMIGYDGAIKLIDFGIAKAAQRGSLTRVGYMKGKVSYVSPEQIIGAAVDHRADIFALGIVLYELVTMQRAFKAATDLETIERVRDGKVVPAGQLVPDLPHELEEIIARAMHVDPSRRYRDADTMRRDLEAFARNNGIALGDGAVITVMEVLFEQRQEPWQDATPVAVDEGATVPVSSPMPMQERRPATLELGSDVIEIHDLPTMPVEDRSILSSIVPHPIAVPSEPKEYPKGSSSYIAYLGPTRPRWPWIAGGALTAVAAAVTTIALWPAEAPLPVAAPPPPPVVAPIEEAQAPEAAPLDDAAPPLPPAPTIVNVRIRISTDPQDATVLLDGAWLGHTPLDIKRPASPGPHSIKIRRRGFVTQRVIVDLDADVSRSLVLQPALADD